MNTYTKVRGVSKRQRRTPINRQINNFPIAEYNKAIQDINNQNFADYCNVYFDSVQLEFDTDWWVNVTEKGAYILMWCDEQVRELDLFQSGKIYDFLIDKENEATKEYKRNYPYEY